MLDDSPFYFHTMRNLVVVFGDVFNGIRVTKEDSAGNTVKTLTVPLAFSRRQKYLSRLREDQRKDADSTAATIELSLPRMSYDIVGIDPNNGNRLNPRTLQMREISTVGVEDYLKQMSGTPVTISMELSIYTYSLDEMLQIVEQIIPYFVPDFNVNILDIPELNIRKDVPIKLENISPTDSFEGLMDEYRIIEWTIGFTTDIEIYPAIQQGGVIRKVINDFKLNDDKILVNVTHELDPFNADRVGAKTGSVDDIVFTSPSTITSTTTDLTIFNDGDRIVIAGSTSNNGTYNIIGTPTLTSMTISETTLTTESGDTVTVVATYDIITTITDEPI